MVLLWLVFLEGILSIDNALVLALFVRDSGLSASDQKKALRYGIWGAFVFRVLAVLLAFVLVKLWWCKLAGGIYLLWLAYCGLRHKDNSGNSKMLNIGFWRLVLKVELMDMAFSIDSILAAVALSNKMWVIISGGMLGIITMRFAASLFMELLDKNPILKKTAYLLVIVIGLKLIAGVWWHAPEWLFMGILFMVLLTSFLVEYIRKRSP